VRKNLVVLVCTVAISFLGIGCGENPLGPTATIVNTSYAPITLNPAVQHIKVGDTIEFIAQGGDGVYKFNLYTSNQFAVGGSIDCSCMFNAIFNGNSARLTLISPSCTQWNLTKVSLNVRSSNNNGWPGEALIVID